MVWRLGPDRAPEWREIRLEALLNDGPAFGSRHEDWADQPLSRYEARLHEARHFASGDRIGAPLAVGCWQDGLEPGDPQLGWIMSVYARPAARGQGYGDALFHHLMQDAKRAGMARLGLRVGQHNYAALRFYARHGFRDTGWRGIVNSLGLPELRLIRVLVPSVLDDPAFTFPV